MIDPQLHDWWSWKQLTELRYQDGLVNGAGVPLRVILPIFADLDLIWLSRIYGEYDDNILLLGIDRSIAGSFELVRHATTSPVQTVYDGDFPDEYWLTEEIRLELGLVFDANGYSMEREQIIAYQVYIHDNCFFFIKPANEWVLPRVIANVLRQHSFYLEQAVDWSAVISDLTAALTRLGRIQLQSDPKRRQLRIPQLGGRTGLLKTFRAGTILIEDGKARRRDN